MIEKPIAHTVDGLEELLKACDAARKAVLTAYNWRYWPPMHKVQELLQQERIGKVLVARTEYSYDVTQRYQGKPARRFYMSNAAQGGGAILDESHAVDYMRWHLGEAAEVFAVIDRISTLDQDSDDVCEVIVRFERGILGNFPEDKQTSETALLFLQLIMRKLKRPGSPSPARGQGQGKYIGGRAAVVVPNGTLFGDGVCARIKEELLKDFNLHTIVRLPNGVFAPYTSIPTNLMFFDRSHPTEEVWYYEQSLPEGRKNYTKTQPIQFEEFADCLKWWTDRQENERAWKVSAKDLLEYNSDGTLKAVNLDRKNPNAATDFEHLPPGQLADDILTKERRIAEIMMEIKAQLAARL